MNRIKKTNRKQIILFTCLLMFASLAKAINVNFRGTLVESIPCEINRGGLIEIDFDTVIIRGIDGNKYRNLFGNRKRAFSRSGNCSKL